ncbi:hypothetical protein, partial [Klebsiella pneumoniae]|uniref:hypothetical protein n=1 Tax=Klebsiella pneumoniae TaxID=573 RepID=UPI001C4F57CC
LNTIVKNGKVYLHLPRVHNLYYGFHHRLVLLSNNHRHDTSLVRSVCVLKCSFYRLESAEKRIFN